MHLPGTAAQVDDESAYLEMLIALQPIDEGSFAGENCWIGLRKDHYSRKLKMAWGMTEFCDECTTVSRVQYRYAQWMRRNMLKTLMLWGMHPKDMFWHIQSFDAFGTCMHFEVLCLFPNMVQLRTMHWYVVFLLVESFFILLHCHSWAEKNIPPSTCPLTFTLRQLWPYITSQHEIPMLTIDVVLPVPCAPTLNTLPCNERNKILVHSCLDNDAT